MNLLRIITTMDPAFGGPCQGIRNSVPELEKLGVHNEVVCLDDPSSPFLGKDPFQIHAIGPAQGPWGYSPNLVPWLLDNFARFDAAIIHGLWLYHSYGAAKAVKSLKRMPKKSTEKTAVPKLFVMPHGMLDPYFQRARERKLKAIRNWIYWKIIEGKVVNEADGLLFTCEAELILAREPFRPYAPKREINVGYGIQTPPTYTPSMREAFLQQCPGVKDSAYILFLSRIHEKKGVDILIEAFSELAGKVSRAVGRSNNSVKLVIAGPGLDSAYGQRMQDLVKSRSEVKDLIFFPGMLGGNAKWGAFYGCDAFILPSHQENFGISVAEALACGKPVLISNQVNIWKEIQAAGGGIVGVDTVEGTKNLLVAWGNLSHEEKLKMGHNATQAFKEKFAIGPAASSLLNAVSS